MKEFHIGTEIYFGESALDRLSQIGFDRVIILADPFVVTSGLVKHVTDKLDGAGTTYTATQIAYILIAPVAFGVGSTALGILMFKRKNLK